MKFTHKFRMCLATLMIQSLLLLLPFAGLSFAQQGGGSVGGGSFVTVPGKTAYELRDYKDTSVCDPADSATLFSLTPALATTYRRVDEILSSLFKIHPYLAYLIRKELDAITWCQTKNLTPTITRDSVELSYDFDLIPIHAATRNISQKRVHLDMPVFLKGELNSRAGLVIHEVLHSFLNPTLDQRNHYLWVLTNKIYKHYLQHRANESVTVVDQQAFDLMLRYVGLIKSFGSTVYGARLAMVINEPSRDNIKGLLAIAEPEDGNPLTNEHQGPLPHFVNLVSEQFQKPSVLANWPVRNDGRIHALLPIGTLYTTALGYTKKGMRYKNQVEQTFIRYGKCEYRAKGTAWPNLDDLFSDSVDFNYKFTFTFPDSSLLRPIQYRLKLNESPWFHSEYEILMRYHQDFIQKKSQILSALGAGFCDQAQPTEMKYFR